MKTSLPEILTPLPTLSLDVTSGWEWPHPPFARRHMMSPLDDGSLSVWFQRQHRPYVNVEALSNHRGVQRAMLDAIVRP